MIARPLVARLLGRTNFDALRIVRDAARHDPDDAARCAFYARWVRPGGLAFDIGANHGNRTRVFVRLGARVVAVEPQPHCARALSWLYGWRKKVSVVAAAAGRDESPKQITQFDIDVLSSMSPAWIEAARSSGRFGELQTVAAITVPGVTLDRLIERHGTPGFVKIDVEGYEPEVLAGLSRPAGTISFELTPELPAPALACVDRLVALGYQRFQFSAGESLRLGDDWTGADGIRALIARLAATGSDFGDVYALDPEPTA
ncbi:MAG TPA: FkbM family methyltransferase [Lacunisphaera sp.]|nr:FkbM family methyltransferase [Lacunisphaera sp.]